MKRATWISAVGIFPLLSMVLACATVDFDHPKTSSRAFDRTQEPGLWEELAEVEARYPGKSGFFLLEDGIDALSARLLLAERAKRTIDAQYYFLLDDPTGHVFLAMLLRAADRGVRVRLLIDDIHTKGYDRGLDAFDSHPNFEVRIFNPFSRRKARSLDFLFDFGRANRRMHNKSFTVDGVATIVGGRNIGAEYFAAREDVNFTDLDVMGFGPVAGDVGAAFDAYWNSDAALPVAALVEPLTGPGAGLPALRERSEVAIEELKETRYADALKRTVVDLTELETADLEWAEYRVVYDDPSKVDAQSGTKDALTRPLADAIQAGGSELFVTSPYFVPLSGGVEAFRSLRERGIEVVIWTNSLGSTDVAAVHAGYAPYRRELLEMGVELYEARRDTQASGADRGGMAYSSASLHAKWFTIDREQLFVGSFNWDPRSAGINTEMGILVDSPRLARQLVESTLERFPRNSYRVELNDQQRLRWSTSRDDGETVVYKNEPDTSLWQRFTAGFMRILPIRGQL